MEQRITELGICIYLMCSTGLLSTNTPLNLDFAVAIKGIMIKISSDFR
jgi:hypothetical protein